jgi:4'-phosphopantetheinyl transferase
MDSPRASLELDARAIHVWRADLDAAAAAGNGRLFSTLAAEERERASRFHLERDRDRFVACRALLRALLGRYTGTAPERVAFRYGPHGKPFPGGAGPAGDIQFSVSHSRGSALFAFGRCEIGVDLEYVRSDLDFRDLAQSCFTPEEQDAIFLLPAPAQARTFFDYWTLKEACIKADGRGLAVPLQGFRIPRCAPGAWVEVVADPDLGLANWRVRLLPVGEHYGAAVAAAGRELSVEQLEVPLEHGA